MTGAPDALDAGRDTRRGFDLQHQVDRAHVDAELERRRGDEAAKGPCFQLVLDEQSLLARDRPVVRSYEVFARQLVDARRQALRQASRVDEDDRRAMRLDQLEQSRVDRGPDAVEGAARLLLRGESRHVLDRDLDAHLHRLQPAGVDDGHLAAGAAEESRDLLQRPLRRRQADALRLRLRDRAQPFEAQRQVRASLGGGDGMDLVDDDPADRCEDAARRAGEQQEERFRRGDEDVRRMTLHRAARVGRRVAGANGRVDVRRRRA